MFIALKHPLMGPVNADKVQPRLLCTGFGSTGEEQDEARSWVPPQLSKQAALPIPGEMASGSGAARTSPEWLILSDLGSTQDFPPSRAALEWQSSGTTDPLGGQHGDLPYLAVRRLFGWINAWTVSTRLFLWVMGRVPPRAIPASQNQALARQFLLEEMLCLTPW